MGNDGILLSVFADARPLDLPRADELTSPIPNSRGASGYPSAACAVGAAKARRATPGWRFAR